MTIGRKQRLQAGRIIHNDGAVAGSQPTVAHFVIRWAQWGWAWGQLLSQRKSGLVRLERPRG